MKAILQRWIAVTVVMILCVYMFTGCGQNADSRTETESSGGASGSSSGRVPSYMAADNSADPTAERVSVLEGREPYDLFAQPWKGFEEEVAAPVWWNQTVYRENLIQDPPDMTNTEKYRAVEDGAYYILALYDNIRAEEEGIEILYYLNRIDGDTLETECHRLYPEEVGLSNPLKVVSLDVAQGKPVVFAYEQDAESQQLLGYYAVWFDQEGHVESSRNLLPALQEAGLVQEDGWLQKGSSKWDSRGYYCVPGIVKGDQYAVMDPEGMLAMVLDPTEGLANPFVHLYHDGQGRCVWEAGEAASENDTVIWCMNEGKQVKLYDGAHPYDGKRIINAYGDVYYVNNRNALVRWDASAGRCEGLYLGGGASFKEYRALLQNSRGAIVLFYDDGYRDYLYEIANEDVEQVELTLAGYYHVIYPDTNMLVQEFNRTHEGVQIILRMPDSWEEIESNWTRVQADLVAGHGPDLLVAPRAQLEPLQKNGLLAELSQIVDQEVQEQIFPGVLEYGMINGGLYSISHSVEPMSYNLIASKELCPAGTWTWEEVVALLEEREQAGRPVRSILNETGHYYKWTGNRLLCYFFLADLEHCSLLDPENGKACFDTEEFCHLLEVCKRYAQTENLLSQETDTIVLNEMADISRQWLKDGEILCYQSPIGETFIQFSEDMAGLGEEYHVVGYPTEGGTGRFMSYCDGIAINAFSPHSELAAEFVNYVISRETQEKSIYLVRKDICMERLGNECETLYDGRLYTHWQVGDTICFVVVKPDGTSYMPEYLDMMDSCVNWSSVIGGPIIDIIKEEAEAFFSGDKDARTVAKIIQSRVQLYLDENR